MRERGHTWDVAQGVETLLVFRESRYDANVAEAVRNPAAAA